MKYKVIAKAGVVVFECDYRRTSNDYIRQALQKGSAPGDAATKKEAV